MTDIYDKDGFIQSHFFEKGDVNASMNAVIKRKLSLILENVDKIHAILKSIEELTPELPPELQPPKDFPKHLLKRR